MQHRYCVEAISALVHWNRLLDDKWLANTVWQHKYKVLWSSNLVNTFKNWLHRCCKKWFVFIQLCKTSYPRLFRYFANITKKIYCGANNRKRRLEQLSAGLAVPRNGKSAEQGKIEDTTTVDNLVDNLVVVLRRKWRCLGDRWCNWGRGKFLLRMAFQFFEQICVARFKLNCVYDFYKSWQLHALYERT